MECKEKDEGREGEYIALGFPIDHDKVDRTSQLAASYVSVPGRALSLAGTRVCRL